MIAPTLNFILSFTFALILHELGHLTAARLCAVPVTEIGLGWGPKLWRTTLHNVDCQLRLLPLGAFVRMDMAELQRRPLYQQLFVLFAGIIANVLLFAFTWQTTFGLLNLGLAIGNVLPLYQHDGWKSCLVISRWLFGRPSPVVEWSITVMGGLICLVLFGSVLVAL
jgi:membrane-associated protease RseP (regulator of RpoE activity)